MGRPGSFRLRVAFLAGLALRSTSFYAQDSVTKVQVTSIMSSKAEVVAEFLDHPHRLPWGRRAGVGDPGPHGQGGRPLLSDIFVAGRDGWLLELQAGHLHQWLLAGLSAALSRA